MSFFASNIATRLMASASALLASYLLVTAAVGPVFVA